jgi:hypothetical protein
MAEKKGFYVRLADNEMTAISLIANYRGESREKAILTAFKFLAEQTFAEEIESGQDFPMQKLPKEVKLSDVLKILGITR